MSPAPKPRIPLQALPPPPEWWQMLATITGILGCGLFLLVYLPAMLKSDPLGTAGGFIASPFYDQLKDAFFVFVWLIFMSYLVATLANPQFAKVERRLQAAPWVLFGGVFVPLIPALFAFLLGIACFRAHEFYGAFMLFCAPLVPLFNGICINRLFFRRSQPTALLFLINGLALVLSLALGGLAFAFPYVATPLALLAMSTSAVTTMFIRMSMQSASPPPSTLAMWAWPGALLLGICLFVWPQLSYEFTCSMVRCANDAEDAAARRAAVRMLRAFTSPDDLLRGAYGAHYTRSVLGRQERSLPDKFRNAYYWVYGDAFNKQSPPVDVSLTLGALGDRDLAGESVGQRTNGVRLVKSELNAEVDPSQAVARAEWIIAFGNESEQAQEARCQILLPPHAVVCGAALWVNGVMKEAAITNASTARSAYRNVVLKQKRDPLLVSWKDNDRVMVQCFPVPPKSARSAIKFKLAYAAPLQLDSAESARLDFPRIVDKNFESTVDTRVDLVNVREAKSNLKLEYRDDAVRQVRLSRNAYADTCEFSSTLPEYPCIVQEFLRTQAAPPEQLIIVIDGAKALSGCRDQLAATLKQLPRSLRAKVIFASDELSSLDGGSDSTASIDSAVKELPFAPFVGGPDNAPWLRKAFAAAESSPGTAVLWIHGAQPIASRRELGNFPDAFYDLQIGDGINSLIPDFSTKTFHTNERLLRDDLKSLLDTICGTSAQYSYRLKLKGAVMQNGGVKALTPAPLDDALTALAVRDYVGVLLKQNDSSMAEHFARRARLITPLTSAVVLETYEDYINNGIKPPEAELALHRARRKHLPIAVPMPIRAPLPALPARGSAAPADTVGSSRQVPPVPASPVPAIIPARQLDEGLSDLKKQKTANFAPEEPAKDSAAPAPQLGADAAPPSSLMGDYWAPANEKGVADKEITVSEEALSAKARAPLAEGKEEREASGGGSLMRYDQPGQERTAAPAVAPVVTMAPSAAKTPAEKPVIKELEFNQTRDFDGKERQTNDSGDSTQRNLKGRIGGSSEGRFALCVLFGSFFFILLLTAAIAWMIWCSRARAFLTVGFVLVIVAAAWGLSPKLSVVCSVFGSF